MCVGDDKVADLLAIGRPTGGITHRVDAQPKPGRIEAQTPEVLHEHDDTLGVGRRIRCPHPLDTHLMELAQTASLRALSTKHCLCVPKLNRSRALRDELILHGGSDDTCRPLGAQRHALLSLKTTFTPSANQPLHESTREDAKHLLANDVRRLTDAVDKGVHLLDSRRLYHVEAVRAKELACRILHVLPTTHVAAIQVLCSLDPLRHGPSSSRMIIYLRR